MADYEENLEDEGLEDDIDLRDHQTLEVHARYRMYGVMGSMCLILVPATGCHPGG
jgi:hypothetical protein